VEDNERRLDFFLGQGVDTYVSQYTLAGEPLVTFNTAAHLSLVALAAGTSESEDYDVFIDALLAEPIPEGTFRYYDGMLYMLSLLVLSGQLTPG
jgi:oligosaccharide reducing-end xylanase